MLVVIRILVGFEFVHAAVALAAQFACSRGETHCQPNYLSNGTKQAEEGKGEKNYSRKISAPAQRSRSLAVGCRCCPDRRPRRSTVTFSQEGLQELCL